MNARDKSLVLLGLTVRQLREASGLTQEILATRAKLDITYISGIERGLRNPSLIALLQLAEGLGIKINQLVKGLDS
jgi:transcriptional regulator with XRE-family HTH domain